MHHFLFNFKRFTATLKFVKHGGNMSKDSKSLPLEFIIYYCTASTPKLV